MSVVDGDEDDEQDEGRFSSRVGHGNERAVGVDRSIYARATPAESASRPYRFNRPYNCVRVNPRRRAALALFQPVSCRTRLIVPGSTVLKSLYDAAARSLVSAGATRVPIASMARISFACGNDAAFI